MFGLKKYLMWATVAFVVFYLITSPTGAAGFVRSVAGGFADAAASLSVFVNALQ